MQTFEVGVLPQSNFFFFSPTAQTQSLFYYQTMCGHFYCTEEYYIKRESVFASSSRLYQLLSLLDNPRRSPPQLKKNDDSINRAIAYIRTHIGEKISLHQLAEISGLSDYYFSHLFKEMTGLSPNNFVIYSRIDQAKALLTTTDLSVAEISAQVGYPNSSNLITLFTQRVGCSPSQFRKENRLSHR